MTIAVGIMQGRLCPPYQGRFQAFPATSWRDEFPRAAAAGLACIEWIFEQPNEALNPLGNAAGIAEIQRTSRETGVAVRSICADYYMTERLVDECANPVPATVEHLGWLLAQAGRLGARYMVLPFVDASSMKTPEHERAAIQVLAGMTAQAEKAGVELHVECDLPPQRFLALLRAVDSPWVKANFDIGNSASLGYDPEEELAAIGPHLGSVHVKDRVRGGGTRPLGTGDANLPMALARVRATGFDRWLILQAARGDDGNEVALATANRLTAERLWNATE